MTGAPESPSVLSVEPTPEIARPVGAFPLATGSLPVSSVHLLLSRWHAEAAKGHQCAKAWGSPGNPAPFHQGWAQALEHCIEELRAELVRANQRQPEENTADDLRPHLPDDQITKTAKGGR